MKLIYTLLAAYRAYRIATRNGAPSYVALSRHGVPFVACFVALDREAWRVSVRAVEEFRKH